MYGIINILWFKFKFKSYILEGTVNRDDLWAFILIYNNNNNKRTTKTNSL